MDNHNLEVLLHDLESDRVERKSSAADRNEIRRAICALANDLPNHQQSGVIFIGVSNDGSCTTLTLLTSFYVYLLTCVRMGISCLSLQ